MGGTGEPPWGDHGRDALAVLALARLRGALRRAPRLASQRLIFSTFLSRTKRKLGIRKSER